MDAARQQGLPVVVSSIWILLGEALWGSRIAMAVLQLVERQFTYPLGDASVQEGNQRTGEVLQQMDVLLPNS